MDNLSEQKKELLNQKTYFSVMKDYYSLKKEIIETMINRDDRFDLIKEKSSLMKDDDYEMLVSKKIAQYECIRYIKKIKKLNNNLNDIEQKKSLITLKLSKN